MSKAYLLLGSNIGDRNKMITNAAEQISANAGEIINRSSIYETAAWGNEKQQPFLNQVLVISTKHSPEKLLSILLQVEEDLGRHRTEKNAPRSIDIDILFFNNRIINKPFLSIPHPQLQNRNFVLVPLLELDPGKKHPVFKKSILELMAICPDNLAVKKI